MRLTVKDVAQLLNVSPKSVYRWVSSHKIPAYRVGDQVRFDRHEIIDWATANRIGVAASVSLEADAETYPLPDLAQALERGGIVYRIEASDRDAALRAVVGTLRLSSGADADLVLEMLRVREQMASTGIGGGVAIPHPRTPLPLQVEEPTTTLCFLEEPIDFGALDGVPVFALFTILSPTARAHLHLLGRTAFVLQDPEMRAAIQGRASRATLLARVREVENQLAGAAR